MGFLNRNLQTANCYKIEHWRFQIFLIITHLFLFIHDILQAHILYVLHKNLFLVAQKAMLCQQKKYLWVTKRYAVAIKKICDTQKRLIFTKHIYCCKEKEYMLTKKASVVYVNICCID